MTHLLAVLALATACVVWFWVQRWAGGEGERFCRAPGPGCQGCEERDPSCEPAEVDGRAGR